MRRTSRGITLLETLTVIAIIALIVAVAVPVLHRVRELARQSFCANNLRQVAQATLESETASGQLPDLYNGSFLKKPACLADEFHYHSWRTMILPYLDQSPLRNKIDFSFAATATVNQPAINAHLPIFVCPSSSNPTRLVREISEYNFDDPTSVLGTGARSDYEAVCGLASHPYQWENVKSGAWGEPLESPNRSPYIRTPPMRYRTARLGDITDGHSNTIIIAERAGRPDLYEKGKAVRPYPQAPQTLSMDYHQAAWAISTHSVWLDFHDWQGVNECNTGGLFSFHNAGANAAMADGSIHHLSDSTDQEVINAIVTRASNEVVSLDSIHQ